MKATFENNNILCLVIISSILPVFIISTSYSQVPQYYLKDENAHFSQHELMARVNDKVFTLISIEDEVCFKIEKVGDFNKNGFDDILIEIITACGGNCCANQFQFIFFDGERFIKSELLGYDWNGIEIKETDTGLEFIIETISEGFNTDMCQNKIETYVVEGFNVLLKNVVHDTQLEAIAEIRSAEFLGRENSQIILKFDINGDGRLDEISATFWVRWGRIFSWSVKFADGQEFSGNDSPKRVGILSSKTNGFHDLVIECDQVLRWDGNGYK